MTIPHQVGMVLQSDPDKTFHAVFLFRTKVSQYFIFFQLENKIKPNRILPRSEVNLSDIV